MNVLLVSECTKKALVETRRILDQFAERRGERTWQTPITQAGLDTLRRLLRKTARKNTAVACHWIRAKDHSELLWIVGDAGRFNRHGAVPTDTTRRDVLRASDENQWHHLPLMTALTTLAALLHDLGKATRAFQQRLHGSAAIGRNLYRHEWVSVRLFQAFVGSDDDDGWLRRLAESAGEDIDEAAFEAAWLDRAGGRLLCDGEDEVPVVRRSPFSTLPPLAQAVAWLILTHHRLPCRPVEPKAGTSDDEGSGHRWRRFGARPGFVDRADLQDWLAAVGPDWNEPREDMADDASSYWAFPHGLPVRQPAWRKLAARSARKLLAVPMATRETAGLDDPFTMHVSRLCLMLADHHYSRQGVARDGLPVAARSAHLQPKAALLANTTFAPDRRRIPNQTLDEHLLGVHAQAGLAMHALPSLTAGLPALHSHRGLKKRSADPRFQWQDKAADLALGVREQAAEHGAFIVNMASTGCGKTLGNARIMNALASPATGLRCAFAIGLRTLTQQTGRVFQRDLGLSDEHLAIHVGGAASRALFAYHEARAEATGSVSQQGLFDEGGHVVYDGHDQHPLLERLTDDGRARALLTAPLLVCTIDHLMPATESLRGGGQIVPMLRLMTGDLVLDEPDDFDMDDLPALTRLVHWAGLLGARVLLSSATLPPALVQGLFLAYLDGRRYYQRHRGARPQEAPRVACLWVDEFKQVHAACADADSFSGHHDAFAVKRCEHLSRGEVRRRAELVSLANAWNTELSSSVPDKASRREAFARFVLQQAWRLHQDAQNHTVDPVSGHRVSFGLIRMANIDPLYDVALALYRQGAPVPGVRVHLCVYHAQFPLLARSHIERRLDEVLSRRPAKDGAEPALAHLAVRGLLDGHAEPHHIFIVLGSPVTEVGRDHDYDWAVVEPSSVRSIVQLAGRVRRHRPGGVARPNVVILDTNLRRYESRVGKAVFCKPGFELDLIRTAEPLDGKHDSSRHFHLRQHDLHEILPVFAELGAPIDARARIRARHPLNPQDSLIDLEHGRMRDTMLPRARDSKFFTPVLRDASLHWAHAHRLWLSGLLPQLQRFRLESQKREDVALLPIDDEDTLYLHRIVEGEPRGQNLYIDARDLLRQVAEQEVRGAGIAPWCHDALIDGLREWAESQEMTLRAGAEKVAMVRLRVSAQGWRFHEVLGFNEV